MVSTRHHPRPFPEPTLPPSRSPNHSSTTQEAPPSPTSPSATSSKRRSTSTRRKTLTSTTFDPPSLNGDADSKLALARSPSTKRSKSKTASSRSSSPSSYVHHAPPLVLIWLFISLPLVTWDTFYVLLRPHSMPGGRFHSPFFTPYALYGTIDYMYGLPAVEKKLGFTAAQGTMNIVETICYAWYLFVIMGALGWEQLRIGKPNGVWRKIRRWEPLKVKSVYGKEVELSVLILFSGAVMTVSKTVLYWLNEYYSELVNIKQNSWQRLWGIWIPANGAWLVLPTYVFWVVGEEILSSMGAPTTSRSRKDD